MIVVIIFQIRISPNFKIRSNGIYWDDGGCLSVSSNIYSIFFWGSQPQIWCASSQTHFSKTKTLCCWSTKQHQQHIVIIRHCDIETMYLSIAKCLRRWVFPHRKYDGTGFFFWAHLKANLMSYVTTRDVLCTGLEIRFCISLWFAIYNFNLFAFKSEWKINIFILIDNW